MPILIQHNGYAESGRHRLQAYLHERVIVETGYSGGLKEYRVASGLPREEAMTRLLDLSMDIMLEFDVIPTGVGLERPKRLEFAIQFGIFYIDECGD